MRNKYEEKYEGKYEPAVSSKYREWLRGQEVERCLQLPLLPEIRSYEIEMLFANKSSYLQSTLGDEEVSDKELLARLLSVLGQIIFFRKYGQHDGNIVIFKT